jgi:hypothetical protein
MSKFVSNRLRKIDLGDGEWVKLPEEISFEDCQGFKVGIAGIQAVGFEETLDLITHFIKEWNFKDDEGQDVPLAKENVRRLKIEVISLIQDEIIKLIPNNDKKKLGKE